MTTSDSINALSAQTVASGAAKARDRLDQSSFLQLMIAQFRNQDPTKPQDPAQFLGQLAQFSTVSGIQDMQSSIGALSESLRSSNALSGAVMVGHSVLAPGDSQNNFMSRAENEPIQGAIDVPGGASNVTITVKDQAGQIVRRFDIPAHEGLTDFSWDGVNDRGVQMGAGRYSLVAEARVNGDPESLPMLFNARVDSVTIDPKTHGLILNTRALGAIAMSDVRRVQ